MDKKSVIAVLISQEPGIDITLILNCEVNNLGKSASPGNEKKISQKLIQNLSAELSGFLFIFR